MIFLIVFGVLITDNSKTNKAVTVSYDNKYKEKGVLRLNNPNEAYSLTSSRYQINEDYIYYGLDTLSTIQDYITCNNCTFSINDARLSVTYDGNVVKTYDLVGIATKYYKLLDEYIYYGFESDVDIGKITCTNCEITKETNKIVIKYGDTTLKEYTFLGLTTTYTIANRTIYVERDYGNEEAIISKINSSVCALEVVNDNHLQVKYNNTVIDNYGIAINNELTVAQDYIVDENRMILYRVGSNQSAGNFMDGINTNARLNILDRHRSLVNNSQKICTGYILRIIHDDDPDNPTDYKISIPGDVLGTGNPSVDNAKEISHHIVDKNVLTGDEYLMAADYDGDGHIKMNDVTKMIYDMSNSTF